MMLSLTVGNAPLLAETSATQQYSSGPWGLGVVIPENSKFADGTRLSWANVRDVSLEVTLPNITFSDYPVLAVESLMASDGSVMQVAAGIYPGNSEWLAYGWLIRDVKTYPQSYDWVLNSSKPEMSAGAQISLSISLSGDRWQYMVENLDTHEAVTGEYASTVPTSLKAGDQEVFALESYTTSTIVFARMGNLTLASLEIDGRNIVSGWYAYGSWDTHHNPLFVVGGLDPPTYISLQETSSGTLVWGYEQWSGSETSETPNLPLTSIVGVVALAFSLIAALAYVVRRTRRGGTSNSRTTVIYAKYIHRT